MPRPCTLRRHSGAGVLSRTTTTFRAVRPRAGRIRPARGTGAHEDHPGQDHSGGRGTGRRHGRRPVDRHPARLRRRAARPGRSTRTGPRGRRTTSSSSGTSSCSARSAPTPGQTGPTVTARALAEVHTAMYDAWAAYDPTADPATPDASLQATGPNSAPRCAMRR